MQNIVKLKQLNKLIIKYLNKTFNHTKIIMDIYKFRTYEKKNKYCAALRKLFNMFTALKQKVYEFYGKNTPNKDHLQNG
ncbi:hypothetical protein SAMN02983004_01118 [Borreliella japonica]|uniref:Uncharacterized protein n=1 Tax=Borreliella japonica TaxID=34095 RepID=A0A1G4QGZ2_BORJA|nr:MULTISPECIES: hypothetical protein [Borreliella]SCW43923.1 hypothetical protein SAMN02983004_01118 [Borreliella japonica]